MIDRLGIRIRRRTRSQFHVPLELRGEPALGPIEFSPHGDARFKREILLTYGGIALTLLASVFVAWDVLGLIVRALNERHWAKTAEQNLFLCVVAFLIYGNLAYQVTRIGYFDRRRSHRPAPPAELDAILDDPLPPPVAILIPSYKEPAGVIRQALLSAALQSYPARRVVLLIDDPPDAAHPRDQAALETARRLPREIQRLLDREALQYEKALRLFRTRAEARLDLRLENWHLARQYERVATWFERRASEFPIRDHTDQLFVSLTFSKRAHDYRGRLRELWERMLGPDACLSRVALEREYRRLACLFRVELASFERKRYENLSHRPNKAMNLNSYIGLLGRGSREVRRDGKVHLLPARGRHADLHVPDAKYLVTLDADSLLDPDYTLRLVHLMERPEYREFAVMQTPYSAVPDPPGTLERIAGATTDIQYRIHQGFTRNNATFWVGANALLRKRALEDIRVEQQERGFVVHCFIQDRTVIEDTESSVDLIRRGWRLFNFPERLSFSATPRDFASLLIQRRRWANGGLIILPKLLGHLARAPKSLRTASEGLLRFHYLSSITAVNIGLLVLILYPFEDNMRCVWLPLTAVPYYFFYGRDLLQAGYALSDLVRVYALNLMLIPVNLAGVAESLRQELTGKRIPFQRTPRVGGGTTASAAVLAAEYLLLLYAASGVVVDSLHRRWLHAAYSLITAACFAYAIFRLIHAREAGEAPDKPAADVMASARARLEMEPAAEREIEPAPV